AASLSQGVNPALAFLLFNGRVFSPRRPLRSRRWGAVVAGPHRGLHSSQRGAIRRKGVQWMQERATSNPLVQRSGADHLLVRPGEIDFRGVLYQNGHRLIGHASERGLDVGLQDVVEIHLVVVEKTIRGYRLAVASAPCSNPRGR